MPLTRNTMGKEQTESRRQFLLTFFDKEGYEEKEVNGFFLVKKWNGQIWN